MALFSKKVLIYMLAAFLVGIAIAALFVIAGDKSLPIHKKEEVKPKNIDDYATAPAVSLLPEEAIVDSPESNLKTDVKKFIYNWDSFNPREAGTAAAMKKPSPYFLSIAKSASPDYLESLVERVDSNDASGVCALDICFAGYQIVPDSVVIDIVKSNNSKAYVTASSVVKYISTEKFNSRDNAVYYRDYGIIAKKTTGRWTIDRASASSTLLQD